MLALAVACAHHPPVAARPRLPAGTGRLQLTCCEVEEVLRDGAYRRQCEPDPTATVEIDGKFAGDCGDFSGDGKDLAAGKHHLQVNASLPHHSGLTEDIEVPEGARISREAWFDELPD